MSKVSFRARALDATKPLPIYRSDEVPDLYDYNVINRAVPQMPTGMEKEEESEKHLQQAIAVDALQKDKPIIPTPDSQADIPYYDSIYPSTVKLPRNLIKLSAFDALGLDAEYADYDMDTDDEEFLKTCPDEVSPHQFERMVETMEKSSENTVISLLDAKQLFSDVNHNALSKIYDYWLSKRLTLTIPLLPEIKTGSKDLLPTDPYAAFRKRQEKMLTRKNRKNDEASYSKMFKLKQEISRAVQLLELVKNREKTKRDLLKISVDIFKKRCDVGDFDGTHSREFADNAVVANLRYGVEEKRRHIEDEASRTTAQLYDKLNQFDTEEEAQCAYPFKRKKHVYFNKARAPPEPPWEYEESSDKYKYSCRKLSRCLGLTRRRVGRGGRVWMDRKHEPEHHAHCSYPPKQKPPSETESKQEINDLFDDILRNFTPSFSQNNRTNTVVKQSVQTPIVKIPDR